MLGYALRRLGLVVPTLAGMSIIIFLMVRLLPGNAVDTLVYQDVLGGLGTRKELRHALGLDQPASVQYFTWIGGVLRGDLGHSLITGRTVSSILGSALPITLELTVFATLVASVIAIPLGVLAAARVNTRTDFGIRTLTLIGLSVPDFWLAILVLLFTSTVLVWSPPIIWTPITRDVGANLTQIAIPGSILAIFMVATATRITRATMLDVLSSDYIRTARAKGLPRREVVYRHALRNALVPVTTLAGVQVASLLSGATILETIFGLPGLGYTLTQAIYKRDYPVIQDTALMLACVVVSLNLVVDLLYVVIDPRIRQQ
jgi:peptide/nickel transport system permease protein